jgi:hypothetical protein
MCIPKVKLLEEIKENKINSLNAKNIVFYASLFCVDVCAAHLFIKLYVMYFTIIFNDTNCKQEFPTNVMDPHLDRSGE